MKNNKGITMVALVLTVVVMAILTGIVISFGSKHLKEAELQDLVTNMLLIQAKAKIGVEEVEFKTANITDQGKIAQIKDENLLGELVDIDEQTDNVTKLLNKILSKAEDLEKDWYYLDNDDLKEIGSYELMSLNNENQYYLYTYNSTTLEIEVLYTGGYITSDNVTYYKLSELESL